MYFTQIGTYEKEKLKFNSVPTRKKLFEWQKRKLIFCV